MSDRQIAFELIKRVYSSGTYSNIALSGAFRDKALSHDSRRFISRLFYGVTERRITLEHVISCYTKKLDTEVAIVLMMGIYQLKYMDSIPDNAAVNESVELVKAVRKSSAAGLVNAVLRRFIREGKKIPPVKGDEIKKLSVEFSCPEELIRRISEGYGIDKCRSLLEFSLLPSDTVIRVNTLLTSPEKLKEKLEAKGAAVEMNPHDSCCMTVSGLGDMEQDESFECGLYHAQDYSSQLCCRAVDPKAGETVIDMCAAPGGKTFTMAELMNGQGRVYACELHEKRTALIKKGAERLKLECVIPMTNDASKPSDKLPYADAVLCDVPCSGYGVIRGKPEIRYKPLRDSEGLPDIQLRILEMSSKYVKNGGRLIYSTCTVNINENENVVRKFLERNPDFEGDSFPDGMGELFRDKFMTAVFPDDFGSDGFFICRLCRKGQG
ncbi:MAG: 16S rRNA (cytosine(967)-C(5))-methyltransferase RsmB [Huintestinicola sp.]